MKTDAAVHRTHLVLEAAMVRTGLEMVPLVIAEGHMGLLERWVVGIAIAEVVVLLLVDLLVVEYWLSSCPELAHNGLVEELLKVVHCMVTDRVLFVVVET